MVVIDPGDHKKLIPYLHKEVILTDVDGSHCRAQTIEGVSLGGAYRLNRFGESPTESIILTSEGVIKVSPSGATLVRFKDITKLGVHEPFYQEILDAWVNYLDNNV